MNNITAYLRYDVLGVILSFLYTTNLFIHIYRLVRVSSDKILGDDSKA